MPETLFIGEEAETHPFSLAGIRTMVPGPAADDTSWVSAAAAGGYGLLFVSESVLRQRTAAVRELQARLPARAALTIVPDLVSGISDHLMFLRLQTTRALGLDTWTAPIDVKAGGEP